MLDIKHIRENLESYKLGATHKNFDPELFDQILALEDQIKPLKQHQESLQASRNQISKQIPKASPEERSTLTAQVKALKVDLEKANNDLQPLQEKYYEVMLQLPSPAHPETPIGKNDEENVEVRTWGNIPKFDFKPLSHIELGEKHGTIDFARGTKLAGSRSYVLKGFVAQLEQAVLRFTYDHLAKKGFSPMSIPVLVKEEAMVGTGYFPVGRDQAYYIEKDQLALVGTSEVALTSFYSGEILPEEMLPCKIFALSSCFRREAGTYGKDTKGLYRVHQFQKVEQVILCKNDPEESAKMHQILLQNSEEVMQALELPYRVVSVCTGDLGQGQIRKHDIESWMPSRDSYGETHSCSTFHDFQARRLKLRYKTKDGKKQLCHTLNNTAIATPRALISLMEVHQQADGSIKIPDALKPYMVSAKA